MTNVLASLSELDRMREVFPEIHLDIIERFALDSRCARAACGALV
jgi:hypothetical protein